MRKRKKSIKIRAYELKIPFYIHFTKRKISADYIQIIVRNDVTSVSMSRRPSLCRIVRHLRITTNN